MKIANALSIVLGVVLSFFTKNYEFIFCCGLVYMFAAIFNVISSIYHGAPLGLSSLISEIVFTSMAFIAAVNFKTS